MLRRNLLAGIALVMATTVSCNSNSVSVGTDGTVTVQAYVDADGSGDYSAGDVVFTASVTLTPASGAARAAVTDANGNAVFENVAPGSYTATISGSVPAGAVLATAANATVVVPFKGGDVTGQFRYVFNPGSIHGVIYRDENGNTSYDAGTDTPAPGLQVSLVIGTDASATPLATTTTDASGGFTFNVLRPETYTIVVTPIPTIQVVGGNTRTVDVTAATTTDAAVRFTGNLLIPISEVRGQPTGTVVAFVGVATVDAAIVGSNQLYMQDANTGVLVFGAPTAGIKAGDTVRVVGAVSVFNGELEIAAPSGGTLTVTKIGSGPVPAARTITVPQLNSGSFAGQLVTVTGVTVLSVATTGATSYNVNLQGSTPADAFQVRIGNTNNVPIPTAFWVVGHKYDVTGLNGVFNGTAQLKPRSAADAVAGPSTLPIADAKANHLNDTVTVVGVVTATRGTFRVDNGYVQDSTSGVQIFNLPSNLTLNLGDTVRVHGKMTVFGGENEITNNVTPTDSIRVTVIGSGAPLAPRVVTGAQFAARTYEGQLVKLAGVTIVTVGTPGGSGTYNVNGTAKDGTSVTIFMSAPTGAVPPPASTFTVGHTYDIAGIASVFSNAAELKPRGASDVTEAPSNVVTIAAAKGVSNDTVTVEGVVTAGQGTFRADNSYIQDASSGVQIFNLPASLALHSGDAVRVHGKMTVFGGENEITNNGTSDSIRVVRLGTGSVTATVVTGAQFAARTFEGQLVTLQGVTILTVGTPGGTGTYTVTATAADATPVTIFMSAPTGAVPAPASTFTVGNHYDVTGIASVFSAAAELKPRGATDVVPR